MVTKTGMLVLGVLATLCASAARAELAEPLTVGVLVEVVGNLRNAVAGPRCSATAQIDLGKTAEWWVVVAAGAEQSTGQRSQGRIECGPGRFSKSLEAAGWPLLVVDISTAPRMLSEFLSEPKPFLDIALSAQRRSGVDSPGAPLYQSMHERRRLLFADSRDLVIPLFIPGAEQQQSIGVGETFLRVQAAVADSTRAAYGAVWVRSDMKGVRVRLDGGAVGEVPESGEFTIHNVLAGDHEVCVRDATGGERCRILPVPEGRVVVVDLNHTGAVGGAAAFVITPLGKNASGYEEYRRARDGAVVVRIPAGEFLMGNARTERHPLEHKVFVSEFLIDKTPVTWAQYKQFAGTTLTPLPPHEPYWGIHDDHPAVFVTWEEAKLYCEWAGARLPTEAEFEKAARGTDGRMYPWGDEDPTPERAVFRRNWGHLATDSVTARPGGASPYGLLETGGNVWEWCEDWYAENYYEVSPRRDPKGPSSGTAHVVRGGSWDSRPDVLSCSCRNWGHQGYREGDFGFRCAMDLPSGQSESLRLPEEGAREATQP